VSARFLVQGVFHLKSRELFVVYGDVLEGEVRPGMEIVLPLNSQLSLELSIEGVEFVDGTPTGFHIGLAIKLDEDLDLSLLQGLNLSAEVLTVSAPGPRAA
jgi:hypothetical protein